MKTPCVMYLKSVSAKDVRVLIFPNLLLLGFSPPHTGIINQLKI